MAAKKQLTLCLVHQHPKILLGMKKRGFGAGRYNGFGGKVEEGETVDEAAKRELKEESGISVDNLEKAGTLDFSWEGKDGVLEVHIFKATEFKGVPEESEEMAPEWFDVSDIPFGTMWPDDKYWMPLFLAGKKFSGNFHFGEGDAIIEYNLNEINN
jgi:8-oxo-dGTP diphosphatase/2-hydroxy-dATP diphosphatase